MKKEVPCITASIVLFNHSVELIQRLISCFDFSVLKHLYLVDNSTPNSSQEYADNSKIVYIHNPENPGFGAAHNLAIERAQIAGSEYHFIVNPDVSFDASVIPIMVKYCQDNGDVGMVMPQILNVDGSIQYLPKLLPNFFTMIGRKVAFNDYLKYKFTTRYELRNIKPDLVYSTPVLSGCFTLLNMQAIKEIGMYDDAYFMYFEDWDLSRRMHEKYRTVYFPLVSVYHEYHSGANKNPKLFWIFMKSMISYFNKWGWFVDKKRTLFNSRLLLEIAKNGS